MVPATALASSLLLPRRSDDDDPFLAIHFLGKQKEVPLRQVCGACLGQQRRSHRYSARHYCTCNESHPWSYPSQCLDAQPIIAALASLPLLGFTPFLFLISFLVPVLYHQPSWPSQSPSLRRSSVRKNPLSKTPLCRVVFVKLRCDAFVPCPRCISLFIFTIAVKTRKHYPQPN